IIQGPLIAGREAIMARKLEEYVAPKLAEELGRKPTIGLLLGSGHTGIEWHLKHPIIRNITIKNYELLNTKPYKQFNPEQIDSVLEISMKNNDLDFTIHKTGLFPRAPDA
ncbi:hypothetical protein GOV10_06575, partial [Candidatus Woesearchaeota archaeon]|nr:hypothetical protein [Candidatus Woesearchaeota archaeon]